MILLKVYQRLGYFPKPETISGAIIGHLRAVMKLPADLVPDIASNHTLYRHHAAIRKHTESSQQIRAVLTREGGAARLLEQCEQVSAHHDDRYQPFIWRFYSVHRKALFWVIKTLDFQSTTSDQALINAMNFIIAHEHDSKKYLEATIDLSFASKKWLRTVQVRRKRKSWFIRQHLETCVFSYLAAELKTGDLCVANSEQFGDYRNQLLSWEECEPKVAEYCQRLNFPMTAEGFVEHLRTQLTEVAAHVDRTRPENRELIINERGEPALKRLRAKATPHGLAQLEEVLRERIPERHLLDVLARIDHITNFTRHFGPLSGNEPKTRDARERQLLTIFAYGTHLGPHQMARHLRGALTADQIAHINHRHVTSEKPEAAARDIIDRFHRFTLPRYWGDEKRVAADGTHYELAEENLLVERHIRYGGYGGIAYHHVSDMYILLFTQFVSCGAWEAVYILDALIRNRSSIKPTTIHADINNTIPARWAQLINIPFVETPFQLWGGTKAPAGESLTADTAARNAFRCDTLFSQRA